MTPILPSSWPREQVQNGTGNFSGSWSLLFGAFPSPSPRHRPAPANRLGVQGIIAQQTLLKFIEPANRNRPLRTVAFLGKHRFGSLVRDPINGWFTRGPPPLLCFPIAQQKLVAVDNPVLLIRIQINQPVGAVLGSIQRAAFIELIRGERYVQQIEHARKQI